MSDGDRMPVMRREHEMAFQPWANIDVIRREVDGAALERMYRELRALLEPSAWPLLDRLMADDPAAVVRLHARFADAR